MNMALPPCVSVCEFGMRGRELRERQKERVLKEEKETYLSECINKSNNKKIKK